MDALPIELVSSIFNWVVHSSPSSSRSPATHSHRDAYRTALRLSHVSQRLRDVAIGCPSLWTTVAVTHDAHHTDSTTCLERSKACPIRLHLDAGRLPPQKVNAVVREFVGHVERWSEATLELDLVAADEMDNVVRLLDAAFANGDAPALTALHVSAPPASSAGRTVSAPVAHELQRLSLRHLGFDWSGARFPQLRELRLSGIHGPEAPSVAQFATLFENAPKLRTIYLKDVTPLLFLDGDAEEVATAAPAASTSTIILSELRDLSLDNTCLAIAHFILSHVSAPNLGNLAIQAHSAPQDLDWSVVRRDTLSEVETFSWGSLADPTDAHGLRISALYRALVSRLPNARHLRLGGASSLREIIPSPAAEEVAVLPRLERLECHGLKGCGLDLLVSLASTRVGRGLPRLVELSVSAKDFSTMAGVGQREMMEVDEAMDSLVRLTGKLDVREREEGAAFRCTFLGWKDYRAYQDRGRQWQYDMEYEE